MAAFGPATVLLVDAASFALSAAVVAATVRISEARSMPPTTSDASTTRQAPGEISATRPGTADLGTADPAESGSGGGLAAGFTFIRREPLVLAITGMLFLTNLADQAYIAVFLPVWVRETGAGPAAFGLIGGVFGPGAVLGAVAYSIFTTRLPRARTLWCVS